MSMKDIAESIDANLGRQNALMREAVSLLRPAPPQPAIGNRGDLVQTDGDYFMRHVPVLQLSFRTQVPDKYLELAPELARIHCPCGAVNELLPSEIANCQGPEGGECQRTYLYTGVGVRVTSPDLLSA